MITQSWQLRLERKKEKQISAVVWNVFFLFFTCIKYSFHSVCPLRDKDKRIMEDSWWERLTVGKLGLVLMDGAMISKSLIQFSVDGQSCVLSLLLDLRPNYGGGNEDNGNLLQKVQYTHCCTQFPWPCSRPPPTQAYTRDSWTLTGKSGSVSCGVTSFFILGPGMQKVLFVPPKSVFPQSCVSSGSSVVG